MTERSVNHDEPDTGDAAQAKPTTPAEPAAHAGTAAQVRTAAQVGTATPAAAEAGAESEPTPSTELVLRGPAGAVPVARARRWPQAVAGLGRRLPQLLRHPATVASASVAATVATRLLVSGLRQASRAATTPSSVGGTGRAGPSGPVAIAGYVLHEVHVIHHHVVHHHVVHNVARPPLP